MDFSITQSDYEGQNLAKLRSEARGAIAGVHRAALNFFDKVNKWWILPNHWIDKSANNSNVCSCFFGDLQPSSSRCTNDNLRHPSIRQAICNLLFLNWTKCNLMVPIGIVFRLRTRDCVYWLLLCQVVYQMGLSNGRHNASHLLDYSCEATRNSISIVKLIPRISWKFRYLYLFFSLPSSARPQSDRASSASRVIRPD